MFSVSNAILVQIDPVNVRSGNRRSSGVFGKSKEARYRPFVSHQHLRALIAWQFSDRSPSKHEDTREKSRSLCLLRFRDLGILNFVAFL